jgi:SNF2 family DNA or RNA helicase
MGNLWGQMVAINSELWESSFEKFARRFLIRDSLFPSRILGVINQPELRRMLLASSNILRREEVYGPDTWQTVNRDVELPPKARKLYNTLVKEWLAENTFGEETIAVPHMLKRMTRLHQLASGYITDEQGNMHEVHTAKVDAVINDLEDIINAGESAVVFHQFSWEGETYAREIERRLGCRVVSINGASSASDRELAIRTINEPGPPCVAIVQTQAGGIGIGLAGATHALFVSQSFNFDDEEQARDRIYAPGERKVVTYYRALQTIDTYIARVLEGKANIHESVRSADIRELAFGELTNNSKGIF